IEISNLFINDNIITFSLIPNVNFTVIDLSIYNNNQKLSSNNFSLESSNEIYTLTINKNIILDNMLYFFINTPTHFSGIIYIYYNFKLLEFNKAMSTLSLVIPSELESSNYNFSFMTFDNKSISSSSQKIGISNGISSNSSVFLISSDLEIQTFEVNLLDNSNNPVPDGNYLIEIYTGG
ncbi:MAG: hypothetical protein ACRCWM_00555, partial [Sarcina sp.]